MKSLKTLFVLAALGVSSLAMAEGGADRTLARMEKARAVSMQAFQAAKQEQAEASVNTKQTNG